MDIWGVGGQEGNVSPGTVWAAREGGEASRGLQRPLPSHLDYCHFDFHGLPRL